MHHYSRYENTSNSIRKEGPLGMREFVNSSGKQTATNPQNWNHMVDKIDLQLKDYLQESAKLTDQLIKKNKKIQKEAKRRLREQEETDSSEEEDSQYVLVAPNSNSRFNALDARDQPIAIPVKPLLALNPRSRTLEKTHMLVPDTSCKAKRHVIQTPRSSRNMHDDNCCLAKENDWHRRHQHQQSCDTDRRHLCYQVGRHYESHDSACCQHRQPSHKILHLDAPVLAAPETVYRLAGTAPKQLLLPVAVETYPQSLREQYIKYRLEPVSGSADKRRDQHKETKKPTKKQTRRHRKRLSVLSESVLSEDVSVAHDDDRDDGVSVSAKSGQSQVVKNNLVQKAKQLKEKEKELLKNVINSQNNMIKEISQEAQNQIGEKQLLEERIQMLEEEIEREKNVNSLKEKEITTKLDGLKGELESAKKEKKEIEYQREVELRALEMAAAAQAQAGKSRQKVSSRTDLANRRSTVASVDLSAMKEFGRSARSKSKTPRTAKKKVAKVGSFIKNIIQASLDEMETRNRSKSPHLKKCCIPYAESRTAKKPVHSTRDLQSTKKKFGSQSVDRNIDFLSVPFERRSLVGSIRKPPSKEQKYELGRVALETGLFATDTQLHGDKPHPPKRRLIRDNLVTALKKKAKYAVIDSLAEMVVKKLQK